MRYINWKWIKYEIKGWFKVINCRSLNWIAGKLIKRKEESKIKSPRWPGWFIKYYIKSIEQLSDYMKYGEETGLQKISDNCWWNKK